MFNKILVPVDGSTQSSDALKTAIEMAKIMETNIYVLHVIDLTSTYIFFETMTALNAQQIQVMVDKLEEDGKKILQDAIDLAKSSGIEVVSLLQTGNPAKIICDTAKNNDCNLIVMGSRGLSDLKGLFLGSVSHQVLQRSYCPVLLVK